MKTFSIASFLLGMTTPLLYSDTTPAPATAEPDLNLFRKDQTVYFTNAEFLYWTVDEGALDYALKMQEPAFSNAATYATGRFKNAIFDWDPGFRIGIGHFNAPHFWDVTAQYTYLHAEGSNHAKAPDESDEFLVGTWIGPDFSTTGSAIPLEHAHSHIHFKYNLVDFLFTRRFYPNPHLRLNLFGGATSAFIYQKWRVRYTDFDDNHSHIRNRWQFIGAGLRLGVHLDWYMGWNLYLTGTASTAILSGEYKNRAFQKIESSSLPVRNTHFRDIRLAYTTQFALGPSWQRSFTNFRTELFLGYELTMWFNLHAIYRSSLAGAPASKDTYINDSAVGLQGLTFRWTMDF